MEKELTNKDVNSNIIKYYIYSASYGAMIPGVVFIVFMLAKGLNYSQIGLLESIFGIAMLLELLTGALSDLIGRKIAVFLGTVFVAIACFGYVVSTTFWHFVVVYIFWGLGVALYSGSDTALVYDSLKAVGRSKDFINIYGKGKMFFLVSGMVGSLIGTYLYDFNQTLPFFVGTFFFLLAGVVILLCKEKKTKHSYKMCLHYQQIKDGLRYLFLHKNVRWCLFFSMLACFYLYYFGVIQTPLLLERNFKMTDVGWILAFVAAIEALFAYSAEKIHKMFSEKTCFALVFSTYFLSSAGFAFAFGMPILGVFVLQKLGSGFGGVLSEHYLQKHSDTRIRATLGATKGFVLDFVIIFTLPLLGIITDAYSLKASLILVSAVVLVLGGILFKFFPAHSHKFVW